MFVLSMPGTEQIRIKNVQMGRKFSNRYLGLSDRVYKWQSISLLCMTWQQNRIGQAIITTPIMCTLRSSHVHLGNNIQTFKINVEY